MYLHINIEGNVLLPQDIKMVTCDTIVETISTPAAVTVASGEYLLSIYLLIFIY